MMRLTGPENHDAAMNMALDESCMLSVKRGDSPPTLRIYKWRRSAISIGYFQCLADEVDLSEVKKDDVPVVRRLTGGGAVYHDCEGEITYSLIAPVSFLNSSVNDTYKKICSHIIEALKSLGVQAQFRPINDIVADKKKISGNAQTRKDGVLLQHGTILYDIKPEIIFRYLTPDKSKISDKPYIKSINSALTSIKKYSSCSREDVEKAIIRSFSVFNLKKGSWSEKELAVARRLAADKYSSQSWTAQR